MTFYATLADVKSELNAENTVDDAYVLRSIKQVSSRLDREFASAIPFFAPVIQTRPIPLIGMNINSTSRTLTLDGHLLSLTGVSVGTQALVVGTNVQMYPTGLVPTNTLQLIGAGYFSWYTIACAGCSAWGPQFATIAGVWGFNADYANAWQAVDTITTVGGINASATSFTVADVDGDDTNGFAPRISAGNMLQIGSEWMDVISTVTGTNTVTVKRGVNGSTAASHAQGAAVSTYQVDDAVRRIVVRQCAFQYARKGAFDSVRHDGFQTITFPTDLLDEVNALLSLFANL